MEKRRKKGVSRRKFVQLAAIATPALALAACGEVSPTTAPTATTTPTTAAPTITQPSATATARPASTPTTAAATTAVPATTQPAATTTRAAATTQPAAATTASAATTTQAVAQVLPATPACTSKASATIAETEGPYFKRSSPERTSLWEAGTTGTKLVVTGYVLTTDCKPVKNALLDFWQADAGGNYDNQGFKMRGHQFTDENGVFKLETVIPGLYPGRTRHIHVKVQAPNQPVLTTQLFFPNEPRNQSDGIFHQALLMQMNDLSGGSKEGLYNFVLKVS